MSLLKLKSMYPLILDSTKNLLEYLKSQTGEVDARNVFSRYTCDSVISCIYGLEAQSFLLAEPFMLKRGQEFIEGIAKSTEIFSSGPVMRSQVHEFFVDLTKDAIKIRNESKVVRDDFLSHFINVREKRGTSVIDVAADCATVFLDGYETTCLALHYAFFELGRNPKAQERLRNEVQENLNGNETLTYEKLLELPYLDQVFHETLRMYSPVLYSTKVCNEETEMKGVKGHSIHIKPGDTFWIPLHSIHRDAGKFSFSINLVTSTQCQFVWSRLEYYSDPDSFIPERFDAENGGIKAFKDRCVLLPFGDGPRICAGTKFAFMQVKAAIAEVVIKFNVSVSDQTPKNFQVGAKQFLSIPECKLMLNFELI